MKFEQENNSIEQEDARLNSEDAHEEANMLRLNMERQRKEATPEDYDEALQELEELKRLAAEGPEGMDKAKQYLTRLTLAGAAPFIILGGILNETLSLEGKGYVKEVEDNIEGMLPYFTKDGVAWTEAQRRLEVLKYDAERKAQEG